MTSSVSLNVPLLKNQEGAPTPITVQGPGSNKAKVKKMVVADPGLGLEVEIESDLSLYALDIQIKLGKEENGQVQYHHAVTYSMDGGGPELDLSESLIFVAPFVDLNYLEEAQHTIDGTDPLHYFFNITYYPTSGGPVNFCNEGQIAKNMISTTGKFAWSNTGITVPVLLPNSESNSSTAFSYSNVLFHELGGAYDIKYPIGLYSIRKALNNLTESGYHTLSNIWIDDFLGHGNIGEYGFCWLPYAKIKNAISNPLDYSIQITDQDLPNPLLGYENLEYNLPSGFQPAYGPLEIIIVNP